MYLFIAFLGPPLRHLEVPRLGVESELQLSAYTTATAMPDLSPTCELHTSSRQRRIPDPLREARDRTHILMDISQVRFCCATTGTLNHIFFTHSSVSGYLGCFHVWAIVTSLCLIFFFYLSVYSFIQHIFIEHLLCARHSSRQWGYSREENRQNFLPSLT